MDQLDMRTHTTITSFRQSHHKYQVLETFNNIILDTINEGNRKLYTYKIINSI